MGEGFLVSGNVVWAALVLCIWTYHGQQENLSILAKTESLKNKQSPDND